jgi:hypothetical protein
MRKKKVTLNYNILRDIEKKIEELCKAKYYQGYYACAHDNEADEDKKSELHCKVMHKMSDAGFRIYEIKRMIRLAGGVI